MEAFLNCYFDQFDKLPRHSLHDHNKRKEAVDYISTLIEAISQNHQPERTAKDAVLILLRFHEYKKIKNGNVCLMGKYHNILYVALKLSYLWQIKDSAVIATLLEEIYSCEKTFERIFLGALIGPKAPYQFAGWKSDFKSQDENLRALTYFLDHANNAGLDFQYQNSCYRFADVPCESCKASSVKLCLQLGLPDKLMILLRFGAVIETDQDETSSLEQLLNKLNESNHCYPYNLVSCLELVLRVVPSLKQSFLKYNNLGYPNCLRFVLTEKYKDLFEDGLLDPRRSGVDPPELKHLCRCVIRQSLWENYSLPEGIRKLPLPEGLKKYLDLFK